MTIAVMQPYLLAYLGYYQLVNASDTFVFFDDVNFINKGWINRNQTLQQGKATMFTVPLIKASQNRKINEIELADFPKWRKDFLKSIEFNYKKAPFYAETYDWLQHFIHAKNYTNISEITCESIISIADLLEMKTQFKFSSKMDYQTKEDMPGGEKILSICNLLNATNYINPINGQSLYNKEQFDQQNVQLNFIKMDEISYVQFGKNDFVPYLSIIDVLMFNGIEETKILLSNYTLI